VNATEYETVRNESVHGGSLLSSLVEGSTVCLSISVGN